MSPKPSPSRPLLPLASSAGLAPLTGGESLEDLYRVWQEVRSEADDAEQGFSAERRQLEEQGAFLLGTVRAARDPEGSGSQSGEDSAALAAPAALQRYVLEAEGRIAASRAALEARALEARALAEARIGAARSAVRDGLERFLAHAPPRLTLHRRGLAAGRAILHLDRPSPDAAMLLGWLLSGRLPSRYGFLFDEATDDVLREPPILYAEEGIAAAGVRPDPAGVRALLLDPSRDALPMRGVIPFLVATAPGGRPAVVQLRSRGAILELEWEAEGAWRPVLAASEAEAAAGHLLRLQLSGRLGLELAAG